MNELKNFAMDSLGTMGVLELTDAQLLNALETDPQSLLIRTVLTLVAGVLTTVISRWLKNKKVGNETTAPESKGNKIKNLFKVKTRKNK